DVVDETGLEVKPAPQLENTIHGALTTLFRHRFDVYREVLLAGRIWTLPKRGSLVAFAIHHSVFDAASKTIFAEELRTIYVALTRGVRAPLAPLPLQYRDYAEEQRAFLDGDRVRPHIQYWREKLAGAREIFRLPYESVPAGVEPNGARTSGSV